MKILSWNVRGLGSARAFHILQCQMRDYKSDIIVLLETKSGQQRLESLRVKLGFAGK